MNGRTYKPRSNTEYQLLVSQGIKKEQIDTSYFKVKEKVKVTKDQRRIVCAANKLVDGRLLLGVRHWDSLMHIQARAIGYDDSAGSERAVQGFIDNHGVFLNRSQAWAVANDAGQIIHRVGGDTIAGGTLFSENLY